MKTQGILVLVTLVVTITTCSGHIGGGQFSLQNIEPQSYCGRDLARAINMLCFGFPMNDKRVVGNSMFDKVMSEYYKDQESPSGWPWIPHHRARSVTRPSREKRFVVNECCEKPCTLTELMSYC